LHYRPSHSFSFVAFMLSADWCRTYRTAWI